MKVRGTQLSTPLAIEVNVDTVYLRSEIQRIETDGFVGWEYDEAQYNKDEYIASLVERSEIEPIKYKLKNANEVFQELIIDEITLDNLKLAKIEQLKYFCSSAIYEGFLSSLGHEFGFNMLDQGNFTQQMLLVVADTSDSITTIQWKTKNNGVVELDKQQFTLVVNEAKDHKLTQQNKYWQLELNVLNSTTKEEVLNINW